MVNDLFCIQYCSIRIHAFFEYVLNAMYKLNVFVQFAHIRYSLSWRERKCARKRIDSSTLLMWRRDSSGKRCDLDTSIDVVLL